MQNLEERGRKSGYKRLEAVLHPLPWLVLASAAKAHGPNRRTALPAGRQPLVRGGGKGAGAGAGRARPPPNQVAL